jgi:hypothetical protein
MPNDMADTVTAPQAVDVETVTTPPTAPAVEEKQTAEVDNGPKEPVSQPQTPAERMIPYSALKEERQKRQEYQRKIAEYEAQKQYQNQPQGDDDDFNKILSHPWVQNLMLQQAKRDLTDHAKVLLDQYPQIPEPIRKAIILNPRGYVNESTKDIDNAKLDLQEYIEKLVEDLGIINPTPPTSKSFPVAATNPSTTESKMTPGEIIKILDKPMDSWTEEDEKTVADYRKTLPK